MNHFSLCTLNFDNKNISSAELSTSVASSKEIAKSAPVFGLEKVDPSKVADGLSVNFDSKQNVFKVPPIPFTASSSVGGESTPKFGASFDSQPGGSISSSPSSGFGTSSTTVASTSSPMFASTTSASAPQSSFTSAVASTSTQPAFGSPNPVFAFGSSPVNNDQMSMVDSMAEDSVQATPPMSPMFGQQPAPVQSNFVFGASTHSGTSPFQFASQQNIASQVSAPSGTSPFQFASQQNIPPQNPSPFQASGGGSFSLGSGGGDKSGRKIIKVKHRNRKKP